MIKKISIGQLRVGMYVHELPCSWMDHPFLFSKFKVKSDEQIGEVVAAGITELYIDTRQGLDAANATTSEEINREVDQEVARIAERPVAPPTVARREMLEELSRARKVHRETQQIMRGMFEDARLGREPDLDKLGPLVSQIGDSLNANAGALTMLARMKDVDSYTFQHSVAVGILVMNFANSLGMDNTRVLQLGIGGLLHDIGKMRTPDAVLNKPGRLTPEEFELMKRHPEDGFQMLKNVPGILPMQLDIVRLHHERLDGSGYPLGLKQQQISEATRIAAIVDVYDALTSDRCYHRGMPPTQALRRLIEWSGSHFDADLVHAFVRCVGIYPVGSWVQLESERIGIVLEQHDSDLLTPVLQLVFDARRKTHLPNLRVDLATQREASDRIVGFTTPDRWGLDPDGYL